MVQHRRLYLNAAGRWSGDPAPTVHARVRRRVKCELPDGRGTAEVGAPVLRARPSLTPLAAPGSGGDEADRHVLPLASQRRVIVGALGRERRLRAADSRKLVACQVWAGNASGAAHATSKALLVRTAR
jgi:hypothetical protein